MGMLSYQKHAVVSRNSSVHFEQYMCPFAETYVELPKPDSVLQQYKRVLSETWRCISSKQTHVLLWKRQCKCWTLAQHQTHLESQVFWIMTSGRATRHSRWETQHGHQCLSPALKPLKPSRVKRLDKRSKNWKRKLQRRPKKLLDISDGLHLVASSF